MEEKLEYPCIESPWPKDKRGRGVSRNKAFGETLHHRLIYRQTYHIDITGKVIRHKCDNPGCIEITHLEIGTQADNVQDSIDRDRRNTKLTQAAVLDIREMSEEGYFVPEIADEFGISSATVRDILARRTWKHI